MIRISLLLIYIHLCGVTILYAQDAHEYLRAADKAYENKEYEKSSSLYEGAFRRESSAKALYNKANALYQMGKYEEAAKYFEESLQLAEDGNLKFKNFHNQGNSFMKQEKFKEAVEAYKNALKIRPEDVGTKQNLARALRSLPPPPPQQKQQEQKKDQNESQEEKKQEQQEEGNQSEEKEQQQQAQSQVNQEGKSLTKEEIDRLLKAVEHEDQSVQKRLKKKIENQKSRPVKDW